MWRKHLKIFSGRNGKGVVYVWAAGNGGQDDNCNADGYVNSVYTIPITSVGSDGTAAWYAEECDAVFAATYSGTMMKNLTSTSLFSDCVEGQRGTSFSTPQASAIVALTLQANPSLTWRDVQHLIVRTSKRHNLDDEHPSHSSWHRNGAGFNVSHVLGFGLMDAEAMVTQAKSWTPVAPLKICCTNTAHVNRNVEVSSPSTDSSSMKVLGSVCSITSLEHVAADVYFSYNKRRGDIELTLKSPAGTLSYLMTPRKNDSILTENESGSLRWNFTSVHFWGENIQGTWTLNLSTENSTATLGAWKLIFYGPESTKDRTTIPTKIPTFYGTGTTKDKTEVPAKTSTFYGTGTTKDTNEVPTKIPTFYGTGTTKDKTEVPAKTSTFYGTGTTKDTNEVPTEISTFYGTGTTKDTTTISTNTSTTTHTSTMISTYSNIHDITITSDSRGLGAGGIAEIVVTGIVIFSIVILFA